MFNNMKKMQREELVHCNTKSTDFDNAEEYKKNTLKKKKFTITQSQRSSSSFFFLKNVPSRPIFKSPSSVFIVSIDVVAVVAC